MAAPARLAAWRALRAIADGDQDLPGACAAQDDRLPDPRDRALLREIVTGTVRWQRALDHIIVQAARRDRDRIDGDVLLLLELSAYQLLHLTRVPASAVVDDAVSLVRTIRHASAAGFVNAVLRALSRSRDRLPLPAPPAPDASRPERLAYLGITLSHPDWLVERWLDRLGVERAEAWVRFNNQPAPVTLRVNPLRATREQCLAALAASGVAVRPAAHAPEVLLVERGSPAEAIQAGLVVQQDEASQLVAQLVEARPGDRVLDLCAAPGGKTTAIAAAMANTGRIAACDVRPRRVRLLAATLRRAGATCAHPLLVAASGALPFRDSFDWVLVDAPCSGLGTLRRDPDVKWRRQPDELPRLRAAQLDLLSRAADAVADRGRLVYATCSSEPDENEEVVRAFLRTDPRFALVNLHEARPAGLPAAVVDTDGMLRTTPDRHGLEAFFGAVLRRI